MRKLNKKQVNLTFQIIHVANESNESEKIKEKVDIINKNFLNKSFEERTFKQLWNETYEYRQAYMKQHTTADIMEQFPIYSNPSLVIINSAIFLTSLLFQLLADVKKLTNVDLDGCVKEKMEILSNQICTDNQFPTGIERIHIKMNDIFFLRCSKYSLLQSAVQHIE